MPVKSKPIVHVLRQVEIVLTDNDYTQAMWCASAVHELLTNVTVWLTTHCRTPTPFVLCQ